MQQQEQQLSKKDKIRKMLREWVWLLRYIRKYWLSVCAFILIGIVSTLMGLFTSVASRELINAVVGIEGEGDKDLNAVLVAMGFMIGLTFGKVLFQALASWISAHIRVRITNEVREEIFRKIMCSRWESIRDYHSGEIINRLEGDVGGVVSGIVGFLPSVVTAVVQFVGAFVIIMVMGDPLMAVVALASAPILLFSAKPMMKVMRRFNEKTRKLNGEVLSFNEEALQNIQLVKAFDLVKQRCAVLKELLNRHKEIQLSYAKLSVWVSIAVGILGILAGYGCYGLAIYKMYIGEMNYGTMTMCLSLSSNLSSAFSSLASLAPAAVSVATSAGRVMEITELPAEEDVDRKKAISMRKKAPAQGVVVEARDMSFTYEDGKKPVMDHVNFAANPGEIVAFVGPSGGGKTTTLRLLLGLLQPQEGSLTVRLADGSIEIPLSDSTRRLCSYVPQGNCVFSGTIRENLTVGAPDVTDEQIRRALEMADAWEFVSAQSEGVDTVLGERGVNLSEGQLQRLSIARALLREAPILIMDEATSALDIPTESRVLQAIMKSDPHRVCLMTTHRTSMLAYADRIIQVDGDGNFVELDPTPYHAGTATLAGDAEAESR